MIEARQAVRRAKNRGGRCPPGQIRRLVTGRAGQDRRENVGASIILTFVPRWRLQAASGFQWSGDPDESFAWMIRFIDRGLQARR